jgi:hypothetical protein
MFRISDLAGLSKTDEIRKNLVSLVTFSIVISIPIYNFFNLIIIGLKNTSIFGFSLPKDKPASITLSIEKRILSDNSLITIKTGHIASFDLFETDMPSVFIVKLKACFFWNKFF